MTASAVLIDPDDCCNSLPNPFTVSFTFTVTFTVDVSLIRLDLAIPGDPKNVHALDHTLGP